MEQVLIYLFSLPSAVIHTIFGGIFGAIFGVVGVLIAKKIKSTKASKVIIIVCLAVSIQSSNFFVRYLQKNTESARVMNSLKENRLISIIFRLHPEAADETEAKYKKLLSSNISGDQLSLKSQTIGAELVQKYFQKHLISASDKATYALLKRNVAVMKSFQDKPSACVSYYLGISNFNKDDLTEDFIKKETDMKADIIESSINNPSLPPQAASTESLIEIIALSYRNKGYDLGHLQKIDQVENLPPEEGCKIATEFSDAIASLDEERSSYVFKNLLYLSRL